MLETLRKANLRVFLLQFAGVWMYVFYKGTAYRISTMLGIAALAAAFAIIDSILFSGYGDVVLTGLAAITVSYPLYLATSGTCAFSWPFVVLLTAAIGSLIGCAAVSKRDARLNGLARESFFINLAALLPFGIGIVFSSVILRHRRQ